jgi:hypothetical protein
VRTATHDTVVVTPRGPVPWATYFAATGMYAEQQPWWTDTFTVKLPTRDGTLHGVGPGLPNPRGFSMRAERVLNADSTDRDRIEHVADLHGIPLFAALDDYRPPMVYYLPLRPGCVFALLLPYEFIDDVGPVQPRRRRRETPGRHPTASTFPS